jgi:NAD(P)H-dependent FMN reductase
LLIGGSLRAGSTNAAVLATAESATPSGVTTQMYRGLAELPPFNPDDDREPLPPAVEHLRGLLANFDAVLISTPEYAGSLPGAFKNLLDWTVGGGMYDKPVGFINASSAEGGAKGAHDTLRVVLGYIGAKLVPEACVRVPVRRDAVSTQGVIEDPGLIAAIAGALNALAERVAALPPSA